jgi:cupin 2 domain-containing protein
VSIFDKLPPLEDEIFEVLHKQKGIKISHIISSSKLKSIEYDQEEDEFVLLLEGEALLEIEGKEKMIKKGEYLFLPAHTKHKVLEVKQNTHWLAIYIKK